MKFLSALLLVAVLCLPKSALASHSLVNSLDLEAGSSQYAFRADNALLEPAAAFTVEGWFKFESLPGSGVEYALFSKGTFTSSQRSFQLFINNDAGTYRWRLQAASVGTSYADDIFVNVAGTTLTAGVWYHLAMTYDGAGDEVKFYLNGAQDGATQNPTTASLNNSTSGFVIGASNTGANSHFDGKVSLARFWKIERTASEINDNKCNVLGATANLSGEWTLDNVATDNSGNGLTLTLNNAPSYSADVPAVCGAVAGASPRRVQPVMWIMED